jgi:Flp pilus assembly protein CpaB
VKTTHKRLAGPSLRGLLATRRGALGVAILCGLAAVGILVFALGRYQHSIANSAKQDTVLVSTAGIPKGVSADVIASRGLYKVMPVLASQVAPGAIVDAGSLSGQVAASNILPGQQLTAADFTAAASGTTGQLTPGERAVAMTLDQSHAVAGVVTAGDHVDVYGSFQNAAHQPVVTLLVANAVILKTTTGSASAAVASGGSTGGTVVLGVSEQLSPRVMWVFDNGKIWLELRGINSISPEPTITGTTQVLLGNYLSATPTYATATTAGVKR